MNRRNRPILGILFGAMLSALTVTLNAQIVADSFSVRLPLAPSHDAYAVEVGDLNGDGALDILLADFAHRTIGLIPGVSGGTPFTPSAFAAPIILPAGGVPFRVSLRDLDGDGKMDLLAPLIGGAQVAYWRNVHTSGPLRLDSLASPFFIQAPGRSSSVITADLDKDGKQDLVVADSDVAKAVLIYRNVTAVGQEGSPSFTGPVILRLEAGPSDPVVADLDGDGRLDLIVPDGHGDSVALFQNLSTPGTLDTNSFSDRISLKAETWPQSVAVADLDADGKLDLAVVNSGSGTLNAYRNLHTGGQLSSNSFSTKISIGRLTVYHAVRAADLDGDGRPDLIATDASRDSVVIFQNTGQQGNLSSASFDSGVAIPGGVGPVTLSVTDLNGDGRLDLIAGSFKSGGITLIQNLIPPQQGPPVVLEQSKSQELPLKSEARFRVMVGGLHPLHYQWRKDGVDLLDATFPELVIPSVTSASAGSYTVVVSNSLGVIESLPASLRIPAPPAGPRLEAHGFEDAILLSWPALSDAAYVLESTQDLAGDSWTKVPGEPLTSGDRRLMSISSISGSRFYRLHKP